MNTDPTMMDYFDEDSEVFKGLVHLDRHGGSSPLTLVIERRDDQDLISHDSYEEMWELHRALEGFGGIGNEISLPVMLAQADERPLSFLLTWDGVVSAMEKFGNERVVRSFLS